MIAQSESNAGSGGAYVPMPPDDQPVSGDPKRMSPWQILVVDDDEWSRQMVRDILEAYPDIKVVGEATDGREAVFLATTYRPDLIIMDIALPYLNGIDATQRIKKALPRTVVIGISGNYIPQVYTAMRTAGAVFFMCKDQVFTIHDTIIHALNLWGVRDAPLN